jgi:hypothetical protein
VDDVGGQYAGLFLEEIFQLDFDFPKWIGHFLSRFNGYYIA